MKENGFETKGMTTDDIITVVSISICSVIAFLAVYGPDVIKWAKKK